MTIYWPNLSSMSHSKIRIIHKLDGMAYRSCWWNRRCGNAQNPNAKRNTRMEWPPRVWPMANGLTFKRCTETIIMDAVYYPICSSLQFHFYFTTPLSIHAAARTSRYICDAHGSGTLYPCPTSHVHNIIPVCIRMLIECSVCGLTSS